MNSSRITYRELKELAFIENITSEREEKAYEKRHRELTEKLYNPPKGYKLKMFWSDKKGAFVNFHVKEKRSLNGANKNFYTHQDC